MTRFQTLSRRHLLGAVGVFAGSVVLAACGETRLPDLPELAARRSITPATTESAREAAPAARVAVKVAIPLGDFLLDRVALRLTALATDPQAIASAPAELTIVPLPETSHPQVEDMAQGLDAVLPSHPDLDAIMLSDAALAFGLADAERVQPVDEVARSASSFERDAFAPVSLAALTDGGQLYGVPVWISANVLRFSERMFDVAGVQPAGADGWTWEAFVQAAQRLTRFDAPDAPAEWGVWLPPGAYPSQQWIWQNGGRVIDLERREPRVTQGEAVTAVEFMAQLQNASVGPQFDLSGESAPRIEFRAGMAYLEGAPVAMMPATVGGGFGASGIGHFFAGAGESGAFTRRVGTFRGRGADQHAGAEGGSPPAALEDPGRLGLMPLPQRVVPAGESRVNGLMSLLSTSQNPGTAFEMMEWLADRIGEQAAVPARKPTTAQLMAINSEYSESDAQAIIAAARVGRAIPGRQAGAIGRILLEEIDIPVLTAGMDPIIASTNAEAKIAAVFEQG